MATLNSRGRVLINSLNKEKKRKEGAQMALRKEKDKEHGHQKNPRDPWQKYRATVNACRKSVRQDKKAYWLSLIHI